MCRENTTLTDNGEQYLERYGKGDGPGVVQLRSKGVHFVGLVNVIDREGGRNLGPEQLGWLKGISNPSRPAPRRGLRAYPPLGVYPQWGWGTDDAEGALLIERFGSVTVLNGHIHQTVKKVEGNITSHTAMSTAFPQPAPGTAPKPGPMEVEPPNVSARSSELPT